MNADSVKGHNKIIPMNNSLCCQRCGSDRIIANATVRSFDDREPGVSVVVTGERAEKWKDAVKASSPLRAIVCCACGHTEFTAVDLAALEQARRKIGA